MRTKMKCLLIVLLTLGACKKEHHEDPYVPPSNCPNQRTDTVTFGFVGGSIFPPDYYTAYYCLGIDPSAAGAQYHEFPGVGSGFTVKVPMTACDCQGTLSISLSSWRFKVFTQNNNDSITMVTLYAVLHNDTIAQYTAHANQHPVVSIGGCH